MVLKLFNTLTRKKEVFKPIHEGEVRMYTCGPTVYGVPHIGNYRSFLMADLIRRYLELKGFKVKHVVNITDIDDKTIRDSAKEGLSLKEFTEKYTKIFFDGLDTLNIKRADVYPKATEHVDEMIKMTKALVEKGYAYVKLGSVYYDISKFKDYGKLSKIDLSGIKPGARVDVDEYAKDAPQDFVLMKRSTTDELKRGIYYRTEWGNVRPGWHIECSAMSMKYLGETFDIHTGGVDLIFPHHENEIAQSEAYTGKKFVNYWLHGEHLLVNGEKMAKSLGNIITLEDVTKKFSPEVIRYMFVSVHYRKKLNYTDEFAEDAKRNYEKLKETFERLNFALKHATDEKSKMDEELLKKLPKIRKKFVDAMDDNLNTPLALRVFHELSKEINKYLDKGKNKKVLDKTLQLYKELSEVFGLKFEVKEEKLPEEAERLIQKREEARKKGDYRTADEIRNKLKEEFGIILEDTKEGVKWKKL
jgi:cysteinyl-tRNA synthetase